MTTRDNVPEATETATAAHALTALRADFPDHEIWREDDGGQIRYIARGRHPHTVVTADLGELRTALSDASAQPPTAAGWTLSPAASRFDPAMPHPARVYAYWLGSKTSDAVCLSSCGGLCRGYGAGEGGVFVVVLAGGQAVVQAAEEPSEEVALGGGVPVAVGFAPVVVGSGAG